MKKVNLFFDGSSLGNPGPAGAGFIITDKTGKILASGSIPAGIATNNQAEFTGLISGLETALKMNVDEITVQGDSQLVINQMKGVFKVKNPNVKPLFQKAIALSRKFKKIDFIHIPREKNKKADNLARKAAGLQKARLQK